MTMTITVTATTAEQLDSHPLCSRFFTISGREVTASPETWALIAKQAQPGARLPKQLGHVWSGLGQPQKGHLVRVASGLVN